MILNLSNSYTFKKIDTSYFFETKENYIYEVYFTDVNAYFEDFPNVQDEILMIGFTYKSNQAIKYNEKIANTIVKILELNLNTSNKALCYTCDSTDNRQKARHILFNKWFKAYNKQVNLFELENYTMISNEKEYYQTLIIQKNNPKKQDIKNAFWFLHHHWNTK